MEKFRSIAAAFSMKTWPDYGQISLNTFIQDIEAFEAATPLARKTEISRNGDGRITLTRRY
jgi:hypothetical protein